MGLFFSRIAVIGLATLLAACAANQPPPAPPVKPAMPSLPVAHTSDTVYNTRFNAMMRGGNYYTPMEAVPGAAVVTNLPVSKHPGIAATALVTANGYAQANNSSALLIWHRGAIVAETYFGGVTANTALVSKSLAKPLSAIVVGRAIKLGFIKSLDEPVSDFITEWRGTPKAAIKVRYLLDMRSGLRGQSFTLDPNNILNQVYLSPHHDTLMINDYPLTHTPGQRFDYANAVGDLVALVIERATGERYAQFVSTDVLQPLGADGGSVWIDRPNGLAHSACCILLPARTWLRLGILLVNDGKVDGRYFLPAGYVKQMRTGTPQNPYYGLGLYVASPYQKERAFGNPDMPGPRVRQSVPFLARDVFMFDGNADQVVYMVPSEHLVILRMGEQPPKEPGWDNALLVNTVLAALPHRAADAVAQPQPHS
jgi:CubicO group peptidase (beta-lactamase class C family)